MADGKKSFVLYVDQQKTVELLTDEQAGKLLKHIYRYVNDENPDLTDPLLQIAFEPIKQQLKRDLEKWKGIKVLRAEAGRKGGKSKKQTEENEANAFFAKQTEANEAVNVNVNVNDNVINNTSVSPQRVKLDIFGKQID